MESASAPIAFGKYELLEKIAIGGMAEVFRARLRGERGFEKHLVIKRILPHLSNDAEFVVMLIDEAKIAVSLSHPNIVQIYDLGKIDGNYFIAMEFIEGADLKEVLRRCNKLERTIPIFHAVFIATEVLKGLDYAHGKSAGPQDAPVALQIIHRDISPPNILLSYEGEAKIVDFGIAKASTRMMETAAGILKGKFEYMSPEQASGLAVDARSDLFSTGLLLYEMLTGKNPFTARADLEVLQNVRNARLVPPRQLNRDVPPRLEQIVMHALHKDPDKRFARASEMSADLLSFCYESGNVSSASRLSGFMHELFEEEIKAGRTASSASPLQTASLVTGLTHLGDAFPGQTENLSRPLPRPLAPPPVRQFLDARLFASEEGATEAITIEALLKRSRQEQARKKPEVLGDGTPKTDGGGKWGDLPAGMKGSSGFNREQVGVAEREGEKAYSFFHDPGPSSFQGTSRPELDLSEHDEAVTTIQQLPQPLPQTEEESEGIEPERPGLSDQETRDVPRPYLLPRGGGGESGSPGAISMSRLPPSADREPGRNSTEPPTRLFVTSPPTGVQYEAEGRGFMRPVAVHTPPDNRYDSPSGGISARGVELPMGPGEVGSVSGMIGAGADWNAAPAEESESPQTSVAKLLGFARRHPVMTAFCSGTVSGMMAWHLLTGSSEADSGLSAMTSQLTIRALDGAEAYVNGNRVGSHYPLTLSLAAGDEHQIQIVNAGYQNFETHVRLGQKENMTLVVVYVSPSASSGSMSGTIR